MVASQGFEPRLIGSEPTVLPLNEEATDRAGAAESLALQAADSCRHPTLRVYGFLRIRSNLAVYNALMDNEIASLFLAHSSAKLEQMTGYLNACLARLSSEQVWERHGPHENAVGNLVLHLCGNMRQWIMHGCSGQADVRVRDQEFSVTEGLTASQLIDHFESTVAEARHVIDTLAPARLIERTTPQGRDVSVLDAIYQVVGHVQQHVGQIILLTKQMTGKDLDLTMPRPR